MNHMLELSGVTAGYGHQTVLRNVDLRMNDGTVVGLIGPNGHGKTTLLRTISGLVRARSGEVRFLDQPISQLPPDEIVSCGIIHVPQGDLLFSGMTVIENLRMGAYLPQAALSQAQRLEEVFTLFPKLAERQNQIASTLSGGERRMVGIGRGLMGDGRLLMLDEPSLGLAPIVIDQIYEAILALKKSGRTILVVEENATRVAEAADQLHLLDDGKFVWSGSGGELLSSPELLSTYLGG